jgi:PAS domain S-box-containing protein
VPRVLIVDDDPALLEALPAALSLRMEGVEVDTCESGTAALELIEAVDFDAVVTDIKMPGMDGLTLLREVKERRPRTPTLLITGHGDRELAVEALRGGAYDFVPKPIDRDYFVASLDRAIAMRRLDRENEQQRQALERHARVLEHVGDGVFLLDRQGALQLWNRAAEAITGLGQADVLGRPAADVLGGWAEVEGLVPVSRAPGTTMEAARTIPLEVGGNELWISVAGVAFDDGTVYAFRNLTGERAVDELRDEFVATVSHELKTPLAAIYGAAKTLSSPAVDLDEGLSGQLLGVIADESERLARIVNDILLSGQLDAGRLPMADEDVDPLDLARGAVERIRGHAPHAAVELVAPSSLPRLHADASRLRQVLDNLLENAVKYSPGTPHVELRVEARSGRLRFAVRDEGLGIPADEQRRIFAKFYRLDPQLTGGVGGTGLGLYICSELVRRMHGRITVSSREGAGSTFVVDLPVPHGANGAGEGFNAPAAEHLSSRS